MDGAWTHRRWRRARYQRQPNRGVGPRRAGALCGGRPIL